MGQTPRSAEIGNAFAKFAAGKENDKSLIEGFTLDEINNLLGSNPERFKYQETAEELRLKLTAYLREVNSPIVAGVENRLLIRD